jgi:small ligand-binding sensory domain FIST
MAAPDSLAAAEALSARILKKLRGKRPDLAFFFVSRHHSLHAEEVLSTVAEELRPRHLLGCTAESVLGDCEEYDGDQPAMSIWAAVLPGVEIESASLRARETPDGVVFTRVPLVTSSPATMFLLGDPFSFPADDFLRHLGEAGADVRVVGGMASAAAAPGGNHLFHGPEVLLDGAVAVTLAGDIDVQIVVSQGCRPFGVPMVVTRSKENFVFELGGKPALQKFTDQASDLGERERLFLSQGLHLGRAVDARQVSVNGGDFLVRNILGVSQETGALLVGDEIRPGQTVQFHLRDPETASEELIRLLRAAHISGKSDPAGGLLFTCNGRGQRLFEEPSHDVGRITREYGKLPLAGFFASGELGPVGRENHLHGFTAVVALFSRRP